MCLCKPYENSQISSLSLLVKSFEKEIQLFKDGVDCWDLRLEKLSKSLSKIMIAAEGVESKHSTSWKHQEWMISSSILGDPII